MINKTEMTRIIIEKVKVPEKEIVKESGHCIHPNFIEHQLN